MNHQELASQINNFNAEDKFTKFILKEAKNKNLVIITSIGDDTVVLNGALTEEFDLFHGGSIFIDKDELAYKKQSVLNDRKKIDCIWEKNRLFTWKFMTKIPHSKFCFRRNNRSYCEGIVFCLNDI